MAVADRRAAVTKGLGGGLSERRSCSLVGLERKTFRYQSRLPSREGLRARLRELAEERVRWGYRRLHVLLRREGIQANHKAVYRLYREEGLAVRRRKRKRVAVPRRAMVLPQRLNERWSMDYVSDVIRGGRRIRIFNVVDALSREALGPQIHAISDETHHQIEVLLTDHQKQLAKAMQKRMHNGKERRRPGSPVNG